MGQYDCNFCSMGKYNRSLAYRIVKDLSRKDMQFILRWNLINKVLKGGKKNNGQKSNEKKI